VAGLLFLLLGLFLETVRSERWVDHTHEVRLSIERTMAALSTAESTQRRYLISGDSDTLAPYAEAKSVALTTAALLPDMVADDPFQQAQARRLAQLAVERITHLDRMIAMMDQGMSGQALDAVRLGTGNAMMAEARALSSAMQAHEAELLDQRAARVARMRDIFIVAALGVGAGVTVVLGVAFHRTRRAAEHDRTVRRELAAALRDRTDLLREINHRVGNSLMMVSSLIDLQAQSADVQETREALQRTRIRVGAVGQVHRRLQKAQTITDLDVNEYVRSLCDELDDILTDGADRITVRGDHLKMPVEQVVPLGLIVIELVTNAIRHGYPTDSAGTVEVRLDRTDGDLTLTVRDWGRGWPAEEWSREGLGMTIVRALAGQLQGTLAVIRNGCTTVQVTVPLPV